jgi:CubicO group peptidase (beta-lactamase class C family)
VDASVIQDLRPESHIAPEASKADKAISFWDMDELQSPFFDTSPARRSDGIAVGELGVNLGKNSSDVAVDNTEILELARKIAKGEYGKYDSLLIAHRGNLVFESYFKKGRIDLPHFQFSASKSLTSLVVGRAIHLGYLRMSDLHKPLIDLVPELHADELVDGAELITLHHALTMRSGIKIDEDTAREITQNSSTRNGKKGTNAGREFLRRSAAITTQSQVFEYKVADPQLVIDVIDAVVPGSAFEFIEKELFAKMGINQFRWNRDINGKPNAGNGAHLTPRDMLKVGLLLANHGIWDSTSLIDKDFLAHSTSGITPIQSDWIPESYLYGYFWYNAEFEFADKTYTAKFSWGAGGQRVIVIEELGVIAVITGHDTEDKVMPELMTGILSAFAD